MLLGVHLEPVAPFEARAAGFLATHQPFPSATTSPFEYCRDKSVAPSMASIVLNSRAVPCHFLESAAAFAQATMKSGQDSNYLAHRHDLALPRSRIVIEEQEYNAMS